MSKKKAPKKEPKGDLDCPKCGEKSEQVVVCVECGGEGCVEQCQPGGARTMCVECEELGL